MLFIFHGWAKLVGAYSYFSSGQNWPFIQGVAKLGFPYPQYFATGTALAEGIFSILLVIGLLTRFSAAVVTFSFLVAVYSHVIGGRIIELPALYLASAIALLFLGAGNISIDALIQKRFARRRSKRVEEADRNDPVSTRRIQKTEITDNAEYPQKPERPL